MKGKIDVGKSQLKGLLVLLAALFVAAFSGCTPKSTPPGADAAGGKLEGASYVFLRWKEGLAIMIWHDVLESSTGEGSGSTTDPIYRYHGYAESPDGRRFDWEVQTADGQTAQFKIDDTGYDLSDGALFLVTTKSGKTEVEQLRRDLSGVQPNRESIVAFAKSDPDVVGFAGVRPNSQTATALPVTQTPTPVLPTLTPTSALAWTPAATPTVIPETAGWETYSSSDFGISLRYPAHWQFVPEHGGEKYAGEDGFFLLDAIGNPTATIDEIAADQAGHKLRPYGSQPRIEALQIQGQEARLILPSPDANMGDQAMLIVRYPQPVEIAGVTYQFFVLYADQAHIGLMAETLQFAAGSDPAVALVTSTPMPLPTSTPTVAPVSVQISSFEVTPAQVDPGDTVTLSWEASGDQATLCPSARFVLFSGDDCQRVSPSGVTTFTVPLEAAGFQFVNFSLSVRAQDAPDPQVWQVSVALKCHTTWFFSDEPQAGICPAEPVHSYAAAQRFERGTMIWLEQLGRYILLDKALLHEQEVRKQVYYVHDPLDIIRDTSAEIDPPGGFYAPESGFGLVWRGDVSNSPGYREVLGWALAPEFGYEAVYQCDDALPSGGRSWQTCYLKGPDDETIVFHPLGGWHLLGE